MPKVVKNEPDDVQMAEETSMMSDHEEEETKEEEEEEEEDDDEWEEITMVVTVNGILDADVVRDAIQRNLVKLRNAETDSPILQLNNSLYTASWTQDLGTNIILQAKGKEQFQVISCTSTMLQAEKALLTAVKVDENSIAAEPDVIQASSLSRTQPRGK